MLHPQIVSVLLLDERCNRFASLLVIRKSLYQDCEGYLKVHMLVAPIILMKGLKGSLFEKDITWPPLQ